MLGPLFAREWLTLPRRPQHYALRAVYLGIFLVLGLTAWQALVGWSRAGSLGDTARFGLVFFRTSVYFQLTLLLFFAALSAAATIAQEKDRRTFVLLLLTDLRNYEIVLGKLLGSLLQIGLLLLGTVALLALGLLLGGVSPEQLAGAVLVLAATSLAAGSLGCLVALWREQTFQSLALTVLLLILYFCGVRALEFVPLLIEPITGPVSQQPWQDVQVALDPYQCLESVLEASEPEGLPLRPPYLLALTMLLWSALLNGASIWRLRAWNPSRAERGARSTEREEETEKLKETSPALRAPPSALPALPSRQVWSNPILWREIRTRAYGRRSLLIKGAYIIVVGLIAYAALAPMWTGGPDPFAAAYGLVPVAILSLLLISAQAVTAITAERDRGALDLLLVTDLTPWEFIFGKLGGIAYNAKEFCLPPLLLAGAYAWLGWLAVERNALALGCVIGTLVILMVFAAVLGVHIGLRTESSRLAITHTLATIFFLSAGTLLCIWLVLISGRFEVQWTSFVLFIGAGVGGLWWVLSGERPSRALTIASWLCPLAMLYAVMNVVIGKPGTEQSSDPIMPFLVIAAAFGFTLAAMLVPLLSEFDVALGRTTGGEE
jgi:ABC-type transport system involved in multi-copper enzyme maturation permease subunit